MFRIRKLDIFIAKQFALLFIGTFSISLFVLMMQFLWRYVDDLIGKGLTLDVLGQFFWYMALMLIPQALPLAILLSSLITFGNLGESSELTAIKAAGISLMQAFRSLAFISLLIMCGSFFFQNNIGPVANQKLANLLIAMKQKSPELEIPEGIFYDGIPDCNLYVQKKSVGTGMLYGVMIYRMQNSYEDAAIILADSGRMQSTAEKKHLLLNLYSGEWFENMKSQELADNVSVPFRRESFVKKSIILDFDSGLNLDDNAFTGNARGKSIAQIDSSITVINQELDSIGRVTKRDLSNQYYNRFGAMKRDSVNGAKLAKLHPENVDTLFAHMTTEDKRSAVKGAMDEVKMEKDFLEFNSMMTSDGERSIREHDLEKLNKFTLSIICLVFFFIGAPLGAIIRKGGLGVPVIISVIVFIIFYSLDTTGFRMARMGAWPVFLSKMIPLIVLGPIAVFFTWKANNDSMVFNLDAYRNLFRRMFGLRTKRSIAIKEVIIHEPYYADDKERLEKVTADIISYNNVHKLYKLPNVIKVFFKYVPDNEIERISDELEEVINGLGNTRDKEVMHMLAAYPVMSVKAHTRPFDRKWMNIVSFCLIPVGLFLYIRMWRFRIRLLGDLKQIHKLDDSLVVYITEHYLPKEEKPAEVETDYMPKVDEHEETESDATPKELTPEVIDAVSDDANEIDETV